MILEDVIKAEDLICLSIIIFTAFIGSFAKDYLRMFNFKAKMSYIKITLSTFTASIIIFACAPEIVSKWGIRWLTVISFFGGLLGFETLQRISTIDGMMELIERVLALLNGIKDTIKSKPPKHQLLKPVRDTDEENNKDRITK